MVKKLARWMRKKEVYLRIILPDEAVRLVGRVQFREQWIHGKTQPYLFSRSYYFEADNGEIIPLFAKGQYKVRAKNKITLEMNLNSAFPHRWN